MGRHDYFPSNCSSKLTPTPHSNKRTSFRPWPASYVIGAKVLRPTPTIVPWIQTNFREASQVENFQELCRRIEHMSFSYKNFYGKQTHAQKGLVAMECMQWCEAARLLKENGSPPSQNIIRSTWQRLLRERTYSLCQHLRPDKLRGNASQLGQTTPPHSQCLARQIYNLQNAAGVEWRTSKSIGSMAQVDYCLHTVPVCEWQATPGVKRQSLVLST